MSVAENYPDKNMKSEAPLSQPITRRDFLKTSTVAASAAAIGTLDLSRSAHAAGSDIIKVGMIGCGGRNAGAAGQALTADPGRAAGGHVRHLPRPHRGQARE